MNILIIEDEVKAAKALADNLKKVRPESQILSILQSVESAIDWLQNETLPDLIFMDIQLADGQCFEIFESVDIHIPVIFCTAYSDHTFEAFRNNGIDYILKPFTTNEIELSLQKLEQFRNFFQKQNSPAELLQIIKSVIPSEKTKTNFLIFSQNRYINVPTGEISYFCKRTEGTFLSTTDHKVYPMKETLEELQRQVSPEDFFRVNRQYLVAFKSIREVQHYFHRKLLILLDVETSEKVFVPREKATLFLEWLSNR
ncbi:MAG: LytTR family DNA-binding domain-containing protein [Chryseobacterium sp.]|nr:LytTR family DNA-binding domain-containing protein [Chryseobacterium sp.]MDN5476276.1 LytTR family DNA-binding domain-containing protein [Chryseobacterium sp.]MDN5481192.1 LytTR family DNA-binding domain-containing protein [Chryseobacterium sp.]